MNLKLKVLTCITLGLVGAGVGGVAVWAAEDSGDSERDIALKDVPPAVRTAIERESKGAGDLAVSMEKDDGFTLFEAEYTLDGAKQSIDVTDTGVITAREQVLDSQAIPKEVVAKLLERHPRAEIKEAESVVSMYYEITCQVGAKEKTFRLYANGQEVECED